MLHHHPRKGSSINGVKHFWYNLTNPHCNAFIYLGYIVAVTEANKKDVKSFIDDPKTKYHYCWTSWLYVIEIGSCLVQRDLLKMRNLVGLYWLQLFLVAIQLLRQHLEPIFLHISTEFVLKAHLLFQFAFAFIALDCVFKELSFLTTNHWQTK